MILFPIGQSGQTVILRPEVLQHFARHRQRRFWQAEAGGQLFARFDATAVIDVVEATGPRQTDRRGRTFYLPDRAAEQREIDERRPQGLHFVGDWHTHAEARPKPSGRDLDSIADTVRRSRHSLNGFILVIVGHEPLPSGLHLSVHDGFEGFRLHPGGELPPERCRPLETRPRVRVV